MELVVNRDMYEGTRNRGLRLAALPESQGGWKEYFTKNCDFDMVIEDDELRSNCALLLENSKQWLANICRARPDSKGRMVINEATRAALVGGFSDYLFPVIRAAFPNNPVNDLVSVQPTTRKVSTVVCWNWVVGKGKGSYTQGSRLFDANYGKQDIGFNFSNETIDQEVIGVGTGSSNAFTGTLKFHDGGGVRPGTVAIMDVTAGTVLASDDGKGGFLGGVTGSIDYQAGTYSVTLNVTSADVLAATYQWDSEGSSSLPEVDVQIVTSTVNTERRALRLNYSFEAMTDVMNEFGVSLEPSLITGAANHMNFEIGRQLVHMMWMVAPVVTSFSVAVPGGAAYTQQQHFQDLIYKLNQASNRILKNTGKAYGNWIIADEVGANVMESLPDTMWQAAPKPANPQGIHFIGTLMKRYRVYKDLFLSKEPGSNTGNLLMGFKGDDFFAAGLVWSPYQLMYTTDTLQTADFMNQKGMASRYATKMVNSNMYVRIDLV